MQKVRRKIVPTKRPSPELKKRSARPKSSILGRARGRGGGLILAKVSLLVFHALHPRRDAADQQVIKTEALGVQGRIFWNLYGFGPHYVFLCFFVWQKGGPPKQQNHVLGGCRAPKVRFWMPFKIQRGPLYWQILADSYLTTPDTGRCRRILAPVGFWRGPPINVFLRRST